MKEYVAIGVAVLAGAALLEAALIPGIVIGGAAVLVPTVLPPLRRRLRPLLGTTARRTEPAPTPAAGRQAEAPADSLPARLGITQAVAKTITFRIVVTALDFTTNYVVLGDFAAAAGLSSFALVAGPVFYLVHETSWNYFGPADSAVDLPVASPAAGARRFRISRALAKTITFRTIATTMDFTVNFVVVGDLATAIGLSAFGAVVGPFVYFGHEAVWDRYGWFGGPTRALPAAAPSS